MCKICKKSSQLMQIGKMTYHFCPNCVFLEKDQMYYLPHIKEYDRYLKHHNDNNSEYINYQKKFATEIERFLKGDILDFGCGESHMLANIINAKYYDKYFYNDESVLKFQYDTIILEEVIEHLKNPLNELGMLVNILKEQGYLIIRTNFYKPGIDLTTWWYLRDQTHYSFFSLKTFEVLSELFNLKIIYCNDNDLIILQKV